MNPAAKGRERRAGNTGEFSGEEGFALMMVLWVLVLLSIVALNHMNATRWNTASTRNLKEETIGYYLALSGYNEAVHFLMSDKDPGLDYVDAFGNFRVDTDSPPIAGKRLEDAGEVDIRITDEDSKININNASSEGLKALFTYAGLDDEKAAGLVDAVLDWRDPDSERRLNGAEDEYYEGLPDPYKAKNAFFDLPEELLLVKGMKPEYLYGSKDIHPILPLITTFGTGNVNINTASPELMTYMGLNSFEVEALLKQRSPEAGGFRAIPPQFADRGFRSMASANLRIEVSGRAKNSTLLSKIGAVVTRQPAGRGFRVRTLYWKEYEESSGS